MWMRGLYHKLRHHLSAQPPSNPLRGRVSPFLLIYPGHPLSPAGAQGIRGDLDILIRKGRIHPAEDLKVVVLTGDGAAYDIGLASTSGAIYRGLDFYYICYDNEAYGNTGFQWSGAT